MSFYKVTVYNDGMQAISEMCCESKFMAFETFKLKMNRLSLDGWLEISVPPYRLGGIGDHRILLDGVDHALTYFDEPGIFDIAQHTRYSLEQKMYRVAVTKTDSFVWIDDKVAPNTHTATHDKMNEHNDKLWTRVPILREERDEGMMVPEIGIRPNAIKQYRISEIVVRHNTFLVVETKTYWDHPVRDVFNVTDVLSVRAHGGKMIVIKLRRGRKETYHFTDDDCAFAFQMDVMAEMA